MRVLLELNGANDFSQFAAVITSRDRKCFVVAGDTGGYPDPCVIAADLPYSYTIVIFARDYFRFAGAGRHAQPKHGISKGIRNGDGTALVAGALPEVYALEIG